ncbi:nucleolar protein dao-5-like isoform X2 [Lethenteron reissneri]|uniref:nucleolar protein dao-5-like isoform X2 n=1 Tax=Lethenteron reissneri TaxID=7753 RepID=UPI002AB7C2F1|nr:nucleolar protein dao-5-like isoform X2 [Lethenteron reissneri]XP_061435073.1 nucleolar protein dao-5-like isoform X2 [Lethenteron reissneri]
MPPPRSRPVLDYSSFGELDGDDDDFRIRKAARPDKKRSQEAAAGKRRKKQQDECALQLSDELTYEQELQVALALSMQENTVTAPASPAAEASTPAATEAVSNPDPPNRAAAAQNTLVAAQDDPGTPIPPTATAAAAAPPSPEQLLALSDKPSSGSPLALAEPSASDRRMLSPPLHDEPETPAVKGGCSEGEEGRVGLRPESATACEPGTGLGEEAAESGPQATGDCGTATTPPPATTLSASASSLTVPEELHDRGKQPEALECDTSESAARASGKGQAKRRSKAKVLPSTSPPAHDPAVTPSPAAASPVTEAAPSKGKSRKKAPAAAAVEKPVKKRVKSKAKGSAALEQPAQVGAPPPPPPQAAVPPQDANGVTADVASEAAPDPSASAAVADDGATDNAGASDHSASLKKNKKAKTSKPVGTARPTVVTLQQISGGGANQEGTDAEAVAANGKKSAAVKPAAAKSRKILQPAVATAGRGLGSPRCRGAEASSGTPVGATGAAAALARSPGGITLRLGLSRFARIKPLHPTLPPE